MEKVVDVHDFRKNPFNSHIVIFIAEMQVQ